MPRISLQQLKDNTGVTDAQLALVCSDQHLKELAEHIEDYPQFANALELKGWKITEINTDLVMNYVMKTQSVLRQWKNENAFEATYLSLLNVVLSLGEGILAIKLCELCGQCNAGDESASGPPAPAAMLPSVPERERAILKQMQDQTGVTNAQLNQQCSVPHLKAIAEHIENYEPFAEILQIKRWRVTEIKIDLALSYVHKTQAILKQWRQDNPYEATYMNLALAALQLREGTVAARICELLQVTVTVVDDQVEAQLLPVCSPFPQPVQLEAVQCEVLTMGHFSTIFEIVKKASKEWYSIGLGLKVEVDELETFEDKFPNDDVKCLRKMLTRRIQQGGLTRSLLCESLRRPLVKRSDVADKIQSAKLL